MFLPFPSTGGRSRLMLGSSRRRRDICDAQRRSQMPRTRKPELTIGAACLALFVSVFLVTTRAQQPAVAIDNDDIGGVVTSTNGPEAGVWVIAETRDLPVRYIKSVVTDDRGRFVVPDLPKANNTVQAHRPRERR